MFDLRAVALSCSSIASYSSGTTANLNSASFLLLRRHLSSFPLLFDYTRTLEVKIFLLSSMQFNEGLFPVINCIVDFNRTNFHFELI